MGNEDTLSTEPFFTKTHETDKTVSEVCNNLDENMSDSPFSEVKSYKSENAKNITIGHLFIGQIS